MGSYLHLDPPPIGEPFSFERLYEYPGAASVHDVHRGRKRVAVVGAGIAGLVATYEFLRLGHEVHLMEAAARTGGRIQTHRFKDGSHGEFGAMRIPASHKCTLHYVDEFGLETRPFINVNRCAFYNVRNRRSTIDGWQRIAGAFNLEPLETVDPYRLYESIMFKAMALLSSEDKWAMFANSFDSPRLREFDNLTLWQYLARWVRSEGAEYIGHTTGMILYENASFLETLIDYFGLFRIDQYQIVDGMSALPDALTTAVQESVRLRSRVKRIAITQDHGVELTWDDDSGQHSEEFDYCICTLPAPVLARVRFSPPPPPKQVASWRGVSYASSSKTLFLCRERPWEFTDGIFGGGSFTDLLNQQIWYPCDNAEPSPEVFVAFTGSDPSADAGSRSIAPRTYTALDPNVSRSPGVLTAAYMWQRNSRRFAAMTRDERDESVLHGIRQLHADCEASVEEIVHHCWDAQSNPGDGAFAYFGPNEHQRYQDWMGRPYPDERPRVFFAGEHLAIAHAWIQGAIQTALTATAQVLRAEPRQATTT